MPHPKTPSDQADSVAERHRRRDFTVGFFVLGLVGLAILQWAVGGGPSVRTVPYSQFQSWAAAGRVSEVLVGSDSIEGRLKSPAKGEPDAFVTIKVDPALADRLQSQGVKVTGAPAHTFLGAVMSWVLPAFAFYLLWSFLFRRVGSGALGGALAVGKSKARLYADTETKVTFDDVAGVDEAKRELQEVVSFLKDPAAFGRLGARAPKGVLLVGPPGTGKTLLARAVAGEAGVPFFSISGAEFVELFVGVGAARVRDLFEQARKAAPAIIFIDELDALGRSRSNVALGGLDEKEQTLDQLLAEIDGFDPSSGVILLAATNRPEILDSALLRAGRFDRQVMVDRPDKRGRLAILEVHSRKVKLASRIDLGAVAALTTGFSGADLANLVNEAAIGATRRKGEAVEMGDFEEAIERILAGVEKRSRVLGPEERRRVAVHEMGHALAAAAMPAVDPVQKVSIIPRGLGALGYTLQRPSEDRFIRARSELEQQVAVLLGGRVAEALAYSDDVSTGASDDLRRATEIASEMVSQYGMDPDFGQRSVEADPQSILGVGVRGCELAEATLRERDIAVKSILDRAETRVREVLRGRQDVLMQGVELLLERETLSAKDFPALGKTA